MHSVLFNFLSKFWYFTFCMSVMICCLKLYHTKRFPVFLLIPDIHLFKFWFLELLNKLNYYHNFKFIGYFALPIKCPLNFVFQMRITFFTANYLVIRYLPAYFFQYKCNIESSIYYLSQVLEPFLRIMKVDWLALITKIFKTIASILPNSLSWNYYS